MKIKIVGAGWYGCHLASWLKQHADVTIVDREGIFAGASGANQSRLHRGWHYPRCSVTRRCSQEHRKQFLNDYGFLTVPIRMAIYAVADESLLDWTSYMASMLATDPGPYEVLFDDPATETMDDSDRQLVYGGSSARIDDSPRYNNTHDLPIMIANCQGAVKVDESLILEDAARDYFAFHLRDHFKVKEVLHSTLADPEYDHVIDCTFSSFTDRGITCYEPCVLWRLRGDPTIAFTVMDGPFGSILPSYMGGGEVTLTGPTYTPIRQTRTYEEARRALFEFTDDLEWQASNLKAQCDLMRHYLPGFDDLYPEVLGFRLGIRAKPFGPADTRQCDVFTGDGNVIHVRPGKIDAIYIAQSKLRRHLDISPLRR